MKRKSSNSYLTSIQTFLERGWVALKKLYFGNAIEMKITFLSKKKRMLVLSCAASNYITKPLQHRLC